MPKYLSRDSKELVKAYFRFSTLPNFEGPSLFNPTLGLIAKVVDLDIVEIINLIKQKQNQ